MTDKLVREVKAKSIAYSKELTVLSSIGEKKDNSDNILKIIGDLGFINSQIIRQQSDIVKENKDFNEAIRAAAASLQLINEVRGYFGDKAIVIKMSDFLYLIKKYKLVCGTFKNYTGVVPESNALEIKEASNKMEEDKLSKLSGPYPKLYDIFSEYVHLLISEVDFRYGYAKNLKKYLTRDEYSIFNLLPLVIIKKKDDGYYSSDKKERICASLKRRGVDIDPSSVSDISYSTIDKGLFICAPGKYMNNKNGVKFSILPPPTEDPFIFSLTPNDSVIIYSMWGPEAEDETLAKYKDFLRK